MGRQGEIKITIRARGKCPKCGGRAWGRIVVIRGRGVGQEVCVECEWEFPPYYYLDFSYQGKRMKIYSDDQGQVLDSSRRADNLCDRIKTELSQHTFDPAKYQRAEKEKFWLAILMGQYLKEKEKEIAPSYWATYKCMAERAKRYFGTRDVREIRRRDINEYRISLEEGREFGPKTVHNYLGHLRAFLNWCKAEQELMATVPSFPTIEIPEPKIVWLDEDEQERLIQFVPEKDRPIICFLMKFGCRPGEARALKVGDVDLRNGVITLRATFSHKVYREKRKGRKSSPMELVIHPEIHKDILPYLRERVAGNLPGAWLFVNSRNGEPYSENKLKRVWEKTKAAAGIEGLRLYDAGRHSVASQKINRGMPLEWVAKLLGHKDAKTTRRYAHMNLEGMRMMLEKFSGKQAATVHELYTAGTKVKIGE